MKCNRVSILRIMVVMAFGILALRCNESLPTYSFPEHVISLNVTEAEQVSDRLSPGGQQMMHIRLVAENTYDEVFQDSVDVEGTMRIWWERYPELYRTIILSERNINERQLIQNGKLTLVPGQKFSMDIPWDMKDDHGIYLPNKMNFTRLTQRVCATNIACADPEQFVIETSMTVYRHLGALSAPPKRFTFVAHTCVDACRPPCGRSATGCD